MYVWYTPAKALDFVEANPQAKFFNIVHLGGEIVNMEMSNVRWWLNSFPETEVITSIVAW